MSIGLQKAKTGGWSKTGILTALDSTKIQSLQVDFPKSEDYTIEFNLKFNQGAQPNGSTIVRAEALIIWSVAGNDVTRRVNIGNGVSVTGVGEAVKIYMQDVTTAIGGAAAVDYEVSAQVAPGSRASVQQPPTLNPSGNPAATILGGGASVNYPIRADAGIISVNVKIATFNANTPIPDQTIHVFHEQGLVVLKEYDPRAEPWVAVAPGAQNVRVQNFGAFNIVVQAVFGIDG